MKTGLSAKAGDPFSVKLRDPTHAMKIAIFSDIHDRLDHLGIALERANAAGAERLFFLGDFCAPFSLGAMSEGFAGTIDAVFGNNDGDQFLLCQAAAKHPNVTLHGHLAELDVEGAMIALNHYPDISRRLAESGAYRAVFSGHDHQQYQHQIGDCLWANPGEIMGRFGSPSIGYYETATHTFEHAHLFPSASP
jgi:putative phosphoesterase